jgi:PAS domain S-box-containing protein
MTDKQILVVEDERIVALDIKQRLEDLGYGVLAMVATGAEAIHHTEALCPDLVLMDINLKGSMDGIEAAQHIHERFAIPVVYLTAYAGASTLERVKSSDPFGYLVKPFESRELHAAVEVALARHQAQVALEIARDELAQRVAERTAELAEVNTQLQREVAERQRAEERYRILFECAPDACYLTDLTGSFVEGNRAAEDLVGYRSEELVGKPFLKLGMLPELEIPGAAALLAGNVDGQATGPGEFTLTRKDGSCVSVEIRTFSVNIDNQHLVLGIARDITERKQFQDRLAAALDQAKAASALKTRILNSVSHDLRTPLSVIVLSGQLLERGSLGSITDQQRRALQRILVAAKRQEQFIKELLDVAQLQEGKLTLQKAEFTPGELTDTLWELANEEARAKGLTLTVGIDSNVPLALYGDIHRLNQILANLVGNAIKFTESGGIDVRVYLPDEKHWALEVSDTGPGIPEPEHSRIFEAFWQADGNGARQEQSGVGLGLAIVRQLTDLMGGDIAVDSEVGHGSTFTIVLPLETRPASCSCQNVVNKRVAESTRCNGEEAYLMLDTRPSEL